MSTHSISFLAKIGDTLLFVSGKISSVLVCVHVCGSGVYFFPVHLDVPPTVCQSIMFWFLLLILLNNLRIFFFFIEFIKIDIDIANLGVDSFCYFPL